MFELSKNCPVGVERQFHPRDHVLDTVWRQIYAPPRDAPETKLSHGDSFGAKLSLGDSLPVELRQRNEEKLSPRHISPLKLSPGNNLQRELSPRDSFVVLLPGRAKCVQTVPHPLHDFQCRG